MSKELRFILATVESDAHTWNLVYLRQLLIEHGIEVINLGPCVTAETVIDSIRTQQPAAVVVSSVNGHGATQGRSLIRRAKAALGRHLPIMIIGGNLTTSNDSHASIERELMNEGYDAVFVGAAAVPRFREWLESMRDMSNVRLGSAGGI
jgi:methylaspartate mutase sigma subunit